jgi:hypothetical protein
MGRDIPAILGMTVLAGSAAVAVAACGTTHPTTAMRSAGTPSSVARPAGTPSPGARPAGTPQQRAVTDAAAILASFVPPPGARRLPSAPDADGGTLKSASSVPGASTLVDDVSWWRVPGRPEAVLAWEQGRLPRRFVPAGTGYGYTGGTRSSWSDTFSLPPVAGVLNTRDLVVEAVSAGDGQTAIRVDAQVAWQPPRPAAERVPSAARVVTITELPSLLPGRGRPPAPVTITDVTVVRRIAALADSLPVSTLRFASCPAMLGGGIQLTFRARPGGPVLAVASSAGSCDTVLFSIAGRPQPALANSASLVSGVLRIAGLHWPGR